MSKLCVSLYHDEPKVWLCLYSCIVLSHAYMIYVSPEPLWSVMARPFSPHFKICLALMAPANYLLVAVTRHHVVIYDLGRYMSVLGWIY
jgi:hypothetical protein